MCLWVRALDVYVRMVKVVGPKCQALHRAETALAEVQAQLTAKRQQLKYVLLCPGILACCMHLLTTLMNAVVSIQNKCCARLIYTASEPTQF